MADRNLRTYLVRAYLATNRVGDAEKVLTAALKKNGLDTDALLQRSRIYLSSGKYTEAETDLHQVLHFRNESAEAHYLLSKVGLGRADTAMQKDELGQTLRLDSRHLAARIELARLLLAERGAQSALQLLDGAPPDQKGSVSVLVQRNWALLALGQKAEARKGIDQLLATGRVPEASLQDGVLKLYQKDYAGARASAERDLSQNPEEVRALDLLVRSYAAQNQSPIGLQKVREHALRQPASAPVQMFLGRLLAASGDRAGARKAFEAAIAAKPGLVTAELALADMDTTEGKRDEARKRRTSPALVTPKPTISPPSLIPKAVSSAANGESVVRNVLRSVTPPSGPCAHRTALGFPDASPPGLMDAPTTALQLFMASPAPTTSPGSSGRCCICFSRVQKNGWLSRLPGGAEVPAS